MFCLFVVVVFTSDCIHQALKFGSFQCPQCGVPVWIKDLNPNRHLKNIIRCIHSINELISPSTSKKKLISSENRNENGPEPYKLVKRQNIRMEPKVCWPSELCTVEFMDSAVRMQPVCSEDSFEVNSQSKLKRRLKVVSLSKDKNQRQPSIHPSNNCRALKSSIEELTESDDGVNVDCFFPFFSKTSHSHYDSTILKSKTQYDIVTSSRKCDLGTHVCQPIIQVDLTDTVSIPQKMQQAANFATHVDLILSKSFCLKRRKGMRKLSDEPDTKTEKYSGLDILNDLSEP